MSTDVTLQTSDTPTRQHMVNYWKEHSVKADVTEMMLDNGAAEISEAEMTEVLSMLPGYNGKAVLELGAGIGRYTERFCEEAKSVIAVDFMESFIEENQRRNGQHSNLKLVCSDVMEISLEENSVDLIFSNWLFMYLKDDEVETLAARMLAWLKPGGALFFRESCYRPSGNKARSFNPTIYRQPKNYFNAFRTLTKKKDDGEYKYNLIFSRPIETYIKAKNNRFQICWLMETVHVQRPNEE